MTVLGLILEEVEEYLNWIVFSLPGKSGSVLRFLWASLRLQKCGKGVKFGHGILIRGAKTIILGEHVKFDCGCSLDAREGSITIGDRTGFNQKVNINATVSGSLTIGEDCLIGPNVIIRTANHNFNNPAIPINQQGHSGKDITIGNNVWIGANAVILPGTDLGDGCVVAAGAVVNKTFPNNTIIGGVPAKSIKDRKK